MEQWYGLQPPEGSGKTFTKAALLLRFLFTTTATPPSASASAGEFGGGGGGGQQVASAAEPPAAGKEGQRSGVAEYGGGLRLPVAGGQGGTAYSGLGATAGEGGLLPGEAGLRRGGGGERGAAGDDAPAGRIAREGRSLGGGRDGREQELTVDESIDPFGPEDDGVGTPGGAGDSRKGELTLLRAQQLQLGGWGSSQGGTLHAVSVM